MCFHIFLCAKSSFIGDKYYVCSMASVRKYVNSSKSMRSVAIWVDIVVWSSIKLSLVIYYSLINSNIHNTCYLPMLTLCLHGQMFPQKSNIRSLWCQIFLWQRNFAFSPKTQILKWMFEQCITHLLRLDNCMNLLHTSIVPNRSYLLLFGYFLTNNFSLQRIFAFLPKSKMLTWTLCWHKIYSLNHQNYTNLFHTLKVSYLSYFIFFRPKMSQN